MGLHPRRLQFLSSLPWKCHIIFLKFFMYSKAGGKFFMGMVLYISGINFLTSLLSCRTN
jgi:hypothetical protein